MPDQVLPRLIELLTPVVAGTGHDLEGLEVTPAGRRRVVRLLVDGDSGVTLDDIAEVSRAVSEALDDIDAREPALLAGAYVLEVSSRGVDTPLTEPRHWRRNLGRLVTAELSDGSRRTGRVTRTTGEAVLLDDRWLPLDGVVRGRVQVEFARAHDPDDPDPDDHPAPDGDPDGGDAGPGDADPGPADRTDVEEDA